jgi:hypothetical protein
MSDTTALHTKSVDELIKDLSDTSYQVKETAANQLAEKKTQAKDALPVLRRLLPLETDSITKGVFLKAIAQIEPDVNILATDLEKYTSETAVAHVAFEALFNHSVLIGQFLPKAWLIFDNNPTFELGKILVSTEYNLDKGLKAVQNYILTKYEKQTTGALLLIGILASKEPLGLIPEWFISYTKDITDKVWETLMKENDLILINYAYWALQRLAGADKALDDLSKNNALALWKKAYLSYLYVPSLEVKLSDQQIADEIIKSEWLTREAKLSILFDKYKDRFEQFPVDSKNKILELTTEQLKAKNATLTRSAIIWLNLNLNHIPSNKSDNLVEALVLEPGGEYATEKEERENLIKRLKQRKSFSSSYEQVLKGWSSKEDIDELVEAIKYLLSTPSKRIFISLFDTWEEWVVLGRKNLVESLFEEMDNQSKSFFSIQYLVRLLDRDITKDKKIRTLVEYKIIPKDILDIITGEKEWGKTKDLEYKLADWINELKEENEVFGEIFEAGGYVSKKDLNELVNNIINEYIKNRQLEAKREISRKLAEMSDDNLIASGNTKQKEDLENIKVELRKYTLPVIAKKIITEKDTEVRENYTRILGNVGGREAVDALTRAISGDERNRSARQELLSKYYLEPSKNRSEEAATMLKEAIEEAKHTLRLLKVTNTITFSVGILLLISGVVIAVAFKDGWTKIAGALTSLGGLAGIIIHLVRVPLDRIQTAMANLVQIETAFTSFIWELNLNGTYIQSQYVAEGVLQDKDIAKTVSRIEGAMGLAMNLVSVYTHNGNTLKGNIKSLSPSVTKAGTVITISGNCLNGVTPGAKGVGMILIDNEPSAVDIKEWNNHEVSFLLPEKLAPAENSKIYRIGLLVDGVETNTLPLKVVANGAN